MPASRIGVAMMHEHVVILSPSVVVGFGSLHDRSALLAASMAGLSEAKSAGDRHDGGMTTLTWVERKLVAEAAAAADINVVFAQACGWMCHGISGATGRMRSARCIPAR